MACLCLLLSFRLQSGPEKLSDEMFRIIVGFFFVVSSIPPAFAHAGHLGELAGHAHWLGLGATVAAGALAAVLAKQKGKKQSSEEEQTPEETSAEGEAA